MNRQLLYIVFFLTGVTLSCSDKQEQNDQSSGDADGTLRISKEQMEKIGMELGVLQKKRISTGISVNGYLDAPPQYKATVSSIISGRITRIRFLPGDFVKKGQQLLEMESPEFVDLQKSFLEIKSELKYLENEYERQKKLNEKNVNARKIFLQAERDYHSKLAQISALENKLKMLQVDTESLTWEDLTSRLTIHSPITGFISKIYVENSEFVHAEDELIRIVNPEHLHAELNVYEKDVLKINKGQRVEIKLSQLPDSLYYGEIFLVGKEIDPETRSVNVHVHLPENHHWVAGMYVEGLILTRDHETYIVPVSSLIREESGTYIYVVEKEQQDEIYLKRIPVTTGTEREDIIEVILPAGVPSDSRFATKGVYYLSSSG